MSNWSKRKRLEATVSGETPDRIPVALWRHWPGDDQDAHALAAAHLKWQQDYDWDVLKVGPASSYSVVDWGVEDEWLGHIEGTRHYTNRPIQKAEDWATLQPLDPTKGMLATQLEALRLVKTAVGDSVPVLATIFAPLSQAKHLADNEPMLTHLRHEPELFRNGLETIFESTLRFIESAKKIGIDGIFYAVQHARYPLMSREEYEIWGRPFDHKILNAVQDLWLNMVHLHSTDVMFDLVAAYPVPLLNWHDRETGISLAEGLTQFKGAASGGVDHWTLHQEPPENTLAEAKDAIEQVNGRRLLLGTGCVAMVTTPLRNIRALRESVNQ
ncbi:uroporphyrinogen decarboxylase family protein [Candidatus Leptofilum sp.]|uniref:uroporphyrinogen decarboxylase family protein n=1 Tax=Candidatus Leptofilum sp. TaxID=3241576 RepID=UPI003B5AAC95